MGVAKTKPVELIHAVTLWSSVARRTHHTTSPSAAPGQDLKDFNKIFVDVSTKGVTMTGKWNQRGFVT